MESRNVLNHGIRVASALALLLAVLTSPIRPPLSSDGRSGEIYLRRNFAVPPTHPTRLSATTASHPERVKALRAPEVDDAAGAEGPAITSHEPARFVPRSSAPSSILRCLHRATYPLRC